MLDIENCTLQTVGSPAERFSEDFLRVLRALRFSGQFGFTIDEGTWKALCHAVSELHVLSAERIQEELMKILSKSKKPSESLQLYASSGVIKKLYPELLGDIATEDFSFLAPCPSSGLIIHGDKDAHIPLDAVKKLSQKLDGQKNISVNLSIVKGADHFYKDNMDNLSKEVSSYLDNSLPPDNT